MKNPLLKALAVDRGDASLATAGGQQRVGGGLGILLADHADRGFRHGGIWDSRLGFARFRPSPINFLSVSG